MRQETMNKLRKIYDILLSVLLIITGIALAIACIQIYRSGDRPFSPASVAQHFLPISGLVYGSLIGVVFGILLDMVSPRELSRPKAIIHEEVRLARQLRKGRPTEAFSEKARKEQSLRRVYVVVTATVFVLLMIWPVIYFTDISHFTVTALNTDVIESLAIALIPGVAGLGVCLLCKHLCSKSHLRELSICKDAAKAEAISPDTSSGHGCCPRTILRSLIAVVAIVFIVIGIFNGGAADVLLKAIAICTECIGLG